MVLWGLVQAIIQSDSQWIDSSFPYFTSVCFKLYSVCCFTDRRMVRRARWVKWIHGEIQTTKFPLISGLRVLMKLTCFFCHESKLLILSAYYLLNDICTPSQIFQMSSYYYSYFMNKLNEAQLFKYKQQQWVQTLCPSVLFEYNRLNYG